MIRSSWRTPAGWVLAVAVATVFALPLVPGDTDLWYHLRHGEEIVQGDGIPESTYFSYLEPPRSLVDYYWLFQVISWCAHAVAGYWGLWLLRALFLALLFFAARRLLDPREAGREPPAAGDDSPGDLRAWLSALLLAALVWILLKRGLNYRPHVIGTACLAWVLWRLEVLRPGGRRAVSLLAVCVLWMNVHGVVYPVLLVVLGAHALDRMQEYLVGRCSVDATRRRLAYLGLLALSILATPHGLSLLPVPFRFGTGSEGAEVIKELALPTLATVTRVDFFSGDLGHNLFVLWLWSLPLATWLWCRKAPFRPSRIVLLATGVYLYTRGVRFHVELVLLSLPLWSDLLRCLRPRRPARTLRAAPAVATLVLLAMLLLRLDAGLEQRHPLVDQGRLPHATADLLGELGGGRLMVPATYGGYMMWALGEEYSVHMDLELPFAFGVEDWELLTLAYHDPDALALVVERYRPDFLLAGRGADGFGERVAALGADYVPVYFDDVLALWADAARHPELAEGWRLRHVDPLRAVAEPAYLPAEPAAAVPELERILQRAPKLRAARSLHVRSLLAQRRAQEAVGSARIFVSVAAETPQPYRLLGDALALAGDSRQAIEAFETALELSRGELRRPIHRRLAFLLAGSGRFSEALRHMERSVPQKTLAPEDDLELLVRLSEAAGDARALERYRRLLAWRRGEASDEKSPETSDKAGELSDGS